MAKATLKEILTYDKTQLKMLSQTHPESYDLYKLFLSTFINNHSQTFEFKRKLSIKLYEENTQKIQQILTEKLKKRQEKEKLKTKELEKLSLQKKIQNLQYKLKELDTL